MGAGIDLTYADGGNSSSSSKVNSDVDEENDDLRVESIPPQNFVDLVDEENSGKQLIIPEEFIVELHSSSNKHNAKINEKEDFENRDQDGFSTPVDKSNSIQIDDVLLDSQFLEHFNNPLHKSNSIKIQPMSQYKQVKKRLIDKQNKKMKLNGFTNLCGGATACEVDDFEVFSQKVFPLKK